MNVTSSNTYTAHVGGSPDPYTVKSISVSDLRDFVQHLTGRLKTLTDGAITNERQNKAVKDLIHEIVWKEHYETVAAWAYSESEMVSCCFPFSGPTP